MNRKNEYVDMKKFQETKQRQQRKYYSRRSDGLIHSWSKLKLACLLFYNSTDTDLHNLIGNSVQSIQTRRWLLKKEIKGGNVDVGELECIYRKYMEKDYLQILINALLTDSQVELNKEVYTSQVKNEIIGSTEGAFSLIFTEGLTDPYGVRFRDDNILSVYHFATSSYILLASYNTEYGSWSLDKCHSYAKMSDIIMLASKLKVMLDAADKE